MAETLVFNVGEAKTQLSKLLDLAASGNDVVIARAGEPVARLTPEQAQVPIFGGWEHLPCVPDEAWFEPLSDEELADWYGGVPDADLPD